ncbi:hypothetical protein [Sandaracinus amylolyticus]|uniref:hypothetical protein n=1 Tax=Sandaracinus amylolyticus TaxID=927083 RepID=UPI001F2A54D3|nr:hypothetical protein [Sandaracinus amylolyticus]UJR85417.1 Hypothetical protein I5071_74970 [Sandaracinus amylolyticus]
MIRGALIGALVIGIAGRAEAQPEVQISSRLALGGGAEFAQTEGADPGALFELALRAEVLFGDAFADRVRVGPAIDVRAANFRTIELAGGAMVLLPIGSDFGITVMAGAGYALRDPYEPVQDRSGAIALGTLALAYRPYDHFDVYGHGVALYASGRAAFAGWESWEAVIGLEVDLEFVVWSPIAFVWTAVSGGDPDG